jgi:hypothetical protein
VCRTRRLSLEPRATMHSCIGLLGTLWIRTSGCDLSIWPELCFSSPKSSSIQQSVPGLLNPKPGLGTWRGKGIRLVLSPLPHCYLNHYFTAKIFKGHPKIHGDIMTQTEGQRNSKLQFARERAKTRTQSCLFNMAPGITQKVSIVPACLK